MIAVQFGGPGNDHVEKSYLEKVEKPAKLKLKLKIISKFFASVHLRMRTIEDCSDFYSKLITAISRPGGYEVYRLVSNMPKSPKSRKPLQAIFLSLLLLLLLK